jgi:ABC-type bacteriocin/lantibiotic exporter with double-glycine peptidase domain
MKPVVQMERTGCGIAAVAAIAGVSYRQAQRTANRLGIFATDRRLWSETAHVRRLLRKYRLRTVSGEQSFRSWSSLPDLALLAIKWHREQGQPCWHWVVFVRDSEGERVLDSKRSLKCHVRRDFGKMKPKWYMAVAKKR